MKSNADQTRMTAWLVMPSNNQKRFESCDHVATKAAIRDTFEVDMRRNPETPARCTTALRLDKIGTSWPDRIENPVFVTVRRLELRMQARQ